MKRHVLIFYVLIAAGLLGFLVWRLSTLPAPQGSVVSEGHASIGGPFRLTDQTGATRSDADFRGRFMLIYFGFTHCPDVCPISLSVIAQAMDKLGDDAQFVVPIFITVDPDRDTPAILKEYLQSFGPYFVGLTGSKAELAKVTKEFHVYAEDVTLEGGVRSIKHSDQIFLLGRDGQYITHFESADGPDKIAKTIGAQF